MTELHTAHPVVHFVGSVPLPDADTVFRMLAASAGPYLRRLPDGETGIRKTWIRFLQQVLADNPAIEVADVPPFKFTEWDGKRLRGGGERVLEPVRATAESRCHPRGGQIPDLVADTDCPDLQQHGPVRPAPSTAGADEA